MSEFENCELECGAVGNYCRCRDEKTKASERPTGAGCSKAYQKETATNIRRNVKHMAAELEVGNDRDSRLLDYLNHIDTLAQEIESSL